MKARWKYAHAQQVWSEMPNVTLASDLEAGDLVTISSAGAVTLATGANTAAVIAAATHILAQGDDTLLNNTVPINLGIYKTDRKVAATTGSNTKNIAVYRLTDANKAWVEAY